VHGHERDEGERSELRSRLRGVPFGTLGTCGAFGLDTLVVLSKFESPPAALILLGFLADFDGLCTFCALFGVISGRTQKQNCGASSADSSVHVRTALPSVKLCALSKADPEPSVFRSNAALALARWRKAARGR
jgi:hypothetical protein